MPRLLAAALALLATAFVLGTAAAPAQAEEGFRYWNYHHLSAGSSADSWEFSQVGSAGYQPKGGAVEGYRYATTANSDKDGVPPRADLGEVDFASVCGAENASADELQVAVLIDYGTEADADGQAPPEPRAECAVVADQANGQQVLDAVADVRTQGGLVCALDGYPAKGCGDPVSDVQVTGSEQPVTFDTPGGATGEATGEASGGATGDPAEEEGSLLWPAVAVALLAGLIGAGAFALNRRRDAS